MEGHMMNNIEGKSGGNESFAEFMLKAAEKRYGKKRWVRWGWIGSSVLLMLTQSYLSSPTTISLATEWNVSTYVAAFFFARLFIFL